MELVSQYKVTSAASPRISDALSGAEGACGGARRRGRGRSRCGWRCGTLEGRRSVAVVGVDGCRCVEF
eukprot:1499817-Rhodomonas_salina.2